MTENAFKNNVKLFTKWDYFSFYLCIVFFLPIGRYCFCQNYWITYKWKISVLAHTEPKKKWFSEWCWSVCVCVYVYKGRAYTRGLIFMKWGMSVLIHYFTLRHIYINEFIYIFYILKVVFYAQKPSESEGVRVEKHWFKS